MVAWIVVLGAAASVPMLWRDAGAPAPVTAPRTAPPAGDGEDEVGALASSSSEDRRAITAADLDHARPARASEVAPLAHSTEPSRVRIDVREHVTGRPVEGARVSIFGIETRTDADGQAVLSIPRARESKPSPWSWDRPGERGRMKAVAEGYFLAHAEWSRGQEQVRFALWPKARIDVHVRDARTGEPVLAAKVTLEQRASLAFHTFTDAAGTASVAARARTPFTIVVAAAGYRELRVERSAQTHEVVELELDPHAGVVGRVLLPDGSPAFPAFVRLFLDPSIDEDGNGPRWETSVATNAGGRYELFVEDPRGLLRVRAFDDHGGCANSDVFTLAPGERIEAAPLVLESSGGEIVVRVLDADGAPIPRARVTVVESSADVELPIELWRLPPSVFERSDAADDRGEFRAPTARAGPHWVFVEPPHASPMYGAYEMPVLHEDLVTVERSGTTSVDVVLPVLSPLGGQLLDSSGAPIADASVLLLTEARTAHSEAADFHVTSDAEGRFRFDAVPPGAAVLVIDAAIDFEGSGVNWHHEAPILLPGRDDHVFTMPSRPTIVGRIASCADAEVAVSIVAHGWMHSYGVEVDADGAFTLCADTGSSPADLQIDAWYADRIGRWSFTGVELRPERILDLGDLHAPPRELVRGVVHDPDGRPVLGAEVHASDDESFLGYCATNEQGEFAVPVLDARPVRLDVWMKDRAPCGTSVDASTRQPVELVLRPLQRVTGRVTRRHGELRGRVEIQAICHDERDEWWGDEETWSDSGGSFELVVAPGRVRFYARPFGEESWIEGPEIEVVPGTSARVTIVVP